MSSSDPSEHNACCEKIKCSPLTALQIRQDDKWITRCLTILKNQKEHQEVPIAALIVDQNNQCIAEACNQPITLSDPTAHAEIRAIRIACQQQKNYRLHHCTLYTTLEPCGMCFNALMQARIERIVFSCSDKKLGILSQKRYLETHNTCNHHFTWSWGAQAEETGKILINFFKKKR